MVGIKRVEEWSDRERSSRENAHLLSSPSVFLHSILLTTKFYICSPMRCYCAVPYGGARTFVESVVQQHHLRIPLLRGMSPNQHVGFMRIWDEKRERERGMGMGGER